MADTDTKRKGKLGANGLPATDQEGEIAPPTTDPAFLKSDAPPVLPGSIVPPTGSTVQPNLGAKAFDAAAGAVASGVKAIGSYKPDPIPLSAYTDKAPAAAAAAPAASNDAFNPVPAPRLTGSLPGVLPLPGGTPPPVAPVTPPVNAGATGATGATAARTTLPTQTVTPFAGQDTAQAWTGGGATGKGQIKLPGGISVINGAADGAPIFTNVPALTRTEMMANGNKLPMRADQSLTFPGVSNLVGNGAGGYTGGTIGVPGSNTQPTAPTALPGSITPAGTPAPYDPANDIADANRDAVSDIGSILSKDPRSPLGIQARNASIDFASTINRGGYRGQGVGPYFQAIDELIGGVKNTARDKGLAALQKGREQSETNRTNITQAGDTQRENLRLGAEDNKPSYQTDADGNLHVVTGAKSKPVMGPDGKPLAVQGKLSGPADATYREIYKSTYDSHIKNGDDEDTAGAAALKAAQIAVKGMHGKPKDDEEAPPKAPEGMIFKGYSKKTGNPIFADSKGNLHEGT